MDTIHSRDASPRKAKRLQIGRLLLALGIILLIAVAGTLLLQRHQASGGSKTATPSSTLVLGPASSSQFQLETVSTQATQEKGLSGRSGLAKNAGMLFAYGNVANRCMWMKDMRFNLDIVWLNADHRVTSLVSDLTPGTYPQSYCAVAQYVVELNAGTTRANGLRVGQIVKL